MEASERYVRGVVDTLTKVVTALESSGIELIGENTTSFGGGRGVRLRELAHVATRAPAGKASGKAPARRRIETPA